MDTGTYTLGKSEEAKPSSLLDRWMDDEDDFEVTKDNDELWRLKSM